MLATNIYSLSVAINHFNCRFPLPVSCKLLAKFVKVSYGKNNNNCKGRSMTQINTYLTFNGNCREAMTFYKECLGGELTLQTVGDSPMAHKMPRQMKRCVLHATLSSGAFKLMASDMVAAQGLVKGNSVSLLLNCSSEEEINRCFSLLTEGGVATHPLENTFYGGILGNLTDKFGNHWLLNYEEEKAAKAKA